MTSWKIERLLWLASVVFFVMAAVRWQTALPQTGAISEGPRAIPVTESPTSAAVLAAAARTVIGSDPFKITRRPSSVEFGTESEDEDQPRRASRDTPELIVAGITGPPWQAVLKGLSSRQGNVMVTEGDTVGEFLILSVSRDSVVVQGPDTTLVLTMRSPWQR